MLGTHLFGNLMPCSLSHDANLPKEAVPALGPWGREPPGLEEKRREHFQWRELVTLDVAGKLRTVFQMKNPLVHGWLHTHTLWMPWHNLWRVTPKSRHILFRLERRVPEQQPVFGPVLLFLPDVELRGICTPLSWNFTEVAFSLTVRTITPGEVCRKRRRSLLLSGGIEKQMQPLCAKICPLQRTHSLTVLSGLVLTT